MHRVEFIFVEFQMFSDARVRSCKGIPLSGSHSRSLLFLLIAISLSFQSTAKRILRVVRTQSSRLLVQRRQAFGESGSLMFSWIFMHNLSWEINRCLHRGIALFNVCADISFYSRPDGWSASLPSRSFVSELLMLASSLKCKFLEVDSSALTLVTPSSGEVNRCNCRGQTFVVPRLEHGCHR